MKRVAKMSKKMKITISFEDKKGKMITKPIKVIEEVPWINEFDELGFDEGFDLFEKAVLESRQKITEKAAKCYFSAMSKKKSKKYQTE